MKATSFIFAMLSSLTVLASPGFIQSDCTFKDYQHITSNLKKAQTRGLLTENVEGAADELKEVLAQEMGPSCFFLTNPNAVTIPEERLSIFQISSESSNFQISIAVNFISGKLSRVHIEKKK